MSKKDNLENGIIKDMKTSPFRSFLQSNMVFLWLALAVALVLAIPFIAMRFTTEVNWSLADFVIIGLLLFAAGLTLIFIGRSNMRYKLLLAVLVMCLLIYIWVEFAVGLLTNLGS